VAGRLHFTGYVTEPGKHHLLGSAWVVLVPSVKEGWGLSIVEAGARSTPSVAFRAAGGVAEALEDGVTGLLADDLDDFVAKTRSLLTKQALRQAMGEAARNHAQSFTWAAAGLRFADVVARAVVDTSGRPQPQPRVTGFRRTRVAVPDRRDRRWLRNARRQRPTG
jgi:glycosyltransferase involved in cell wall biosynthesis